VQELGHHATSIEIEAGSRRGAVFLFAGKRIRGGAAGARCADIDLDRSEQFAQGAAQRTASNRPLPGAEAALFL